MKRKAIIITGAVLALAVCVTALAAIPGDKNKTTTTSSSVVKNGIPKANVAVLEIRPVELDTTIYLNGITTAKKDITYAAKSAGRLEYVGAEIGKNVRRGAVLARVDYQTLRARKMQAQAAYDLAEATHRRMQALGESLASAQKLDESKYAMQGTKANLDLAIATAADAIVRTEGRGTVAAKYVEQGEFVSPGTPLYRIVDTRTIIVEAAVAETQVKAVSAGTKVTVKIDALEKEVTGTVETIVPQANPASKTFTVRVSIDNRDQRILVGMSASLRIKAGHQDNVLAIPQDVIIEENAGRHVYVISHGVAQKRPVTLGAVDKDEVVITNGLSPNDLLVVFGQRNLADNQPVNIVDNPHATKAI